MSENVRRYGGSKKAQTFRQIEKEARKYFEERFGKPAAGALDEIRRAAATEALRPDLYGLGEIGKYGSGDEFPTPQVGPTMVRTPALGIPAAIAGLDEVLGDVLAALGRLEERLAPMMLPEPGGKEQGEVPRAAMSPLALEITQRADVARGVRGKLLTMIDRLDM